MRKQSTARNEVFDQATFASSTSTVGASKTVFDFHVIGDPSLDQKIVKKLDTLRKEKGIVFETIHEVNAHLEELM